MDLDRAAEVFRDFVAIVKALRTPGTGCPWDLEQDHRSLRPYVVEETYEVLEAIDHGDDRSLCDELGDLLLQVVLHAQLADDRGAFSIEQVIRGIADKMIRRHPHVFGQTPVSGADEVRRNWEQIKAVENGQKSDPAAELERIPRALPALQRAQRLGEKASRGNCQGLTPETTAAAAAAAMEQFQAGVQAGQQSPAALGELLFQLCQLARLLGINAEDALRETCQRFIDQRRGP